VAYDRADIRRQFRRLPPKVAAVIALRAAMRIFPALAQRRHATDAAFWFWPAEDTTSAGAFNLPLSAIARRKPSTLPPAPPTTSPPRRPPPPSLSSRPPPRPIVPPARPTPSPPPPAPTASWPLRLPTPLFQRILHRFNGRRGSPANRAGRARRRTRYSCWLNLCGWNACPPKPPGCGHSCRGTCAASAPDSRSGSTGIRTGSTGSPSTGRSSGNGLF
jgi:hypothetical protein